MASSSSSTAAGSFTYDVFLSFRGEDTRNTFVSFLYRYLMKDAGISVFDVDGTSLRTGESIDSALRAAIQGSKISIPIFSERYAESKWCLTELVEIAKCYRSSGQLVLPIFFKIDPSDVRNQRGSFAEALQNHEKRFEPHIVKGWRDALKEVGSLTGEVVDDTTDQAEVVEYVVKRVLRELSYKTYMVECKYPIGINSSINNLLSLLDFGSDDVKFVGICGFGGIGKTTIAKAVYNHTISTFNMHSFIPDVREQAMQNLGLVSLQQQLLKDILKVENIDIPNCAVGVQLIKQRLCKRKVLIVLDDVDRVEQVDALAGDSRWFGLGSRVIITTRDQEILNRANVYQDKIYMPQLLDHDQSLQLFSLHAFSSELPPKDYLELSKDVAYHSGGLPLALEVLGSSLSCRSIKEWKSTLQYLKETSPEKVQARLRISYDSLEREDEKAIFLDAACYFIGWEKEVLISIWDACGYHPRSAIPILMKKSLIKFEDKYKDGKCVVLKMHDHIRDMGRGIVLGENRLDPSKRSRLWSHDDILQVLETNVGTKMTKSLILHGGLSHVYLHEHHFKMMPNLRFLDITSERVSGNFRSLPSRLRWLRWTNCPWEIIPSKFYHKGLVHLQLSGFRIQQAWNIGPRDKNQRFQKLKVLDLNGCDLTHSPNFSWFPYLKQLDLSYCSKLEILDESIGQLSRLKSLNLEWCRRIMELPNSIGDLKSLVELNLSSTSIEKLPHNLSKLTSLKSLELIGCSSLKKLPEFGLQSLVELNFKVYEERDFDGDSVDDFVDDDKGIEESTIEDI